jgi:GPN-loop GTPase
LKAIFVTGTAGCGKSLLTSRLLQWYEDNDTFAAALNLDPGAGELPYAPDIDVRDYVDVTTIMQSYGLGPNGSIVMASDMIATKQQELQNEIEQINSDYLIIDTPGQIELFAFRASGPYFATNLKAESKANIFVFDGVLISSPLNFVSISLLSTSINLRLNMASIGVLSKRDLVIDQLPHILEWASSIDSLEAALSKERENEYSFLGTELARSLFKGGFSNSLIPVSSLTMNGISDLGAALARTLNQGEDG